MPIKSSPYAILKTFADDLKLLPLCPRTEEALRLRAPAQRVFTANPPTSSPEQIRQYCIHLKTGKKVARQTSTQAICAIKLFWEKTLRRDWPHELELARASPQFKLPVVLSLAKCAPSSPASALDHRVWPEHHLFLRPALGQGLRLEVRDIDSQRMLCIPRKQGNRDRYVPVPQRTLQLLRGAMEDSSPSQPAWL